MLKTSERQVLNYIFSSLDMENPVFPVILGRKDIKSNTIYSLRTVTRAILRLEKLGLIRVNRSKTVFRGHLKSSYCLTKEGLSLYGINEIKSTKKLRAIK